MSTVFINSYRFGSAFAGALDGIPNLVHVYGFRRWLSAYTGNLIRIRRSSDNAEQDFGYVANGDLDTAAIATFIGGGSGFIKTIYDQVGSNNPTQATTSAQPLYVASGQNGKPVGRYNGTSQWLRVAYSGALSQPYTIYAAAKLGAGLADDGNRYFLVDGDDTSNRAAMYKENVTTPDSTSIFAGSAVVWTTAANTNWGIWTALFNTTASELWINGTSQGAAASAGTHNADGITIGARFDGAAFWWNGDIATVVVADPNHDDTQRATVRTAINDYYAIF